MKKNKAKTSFWQKLALIIGGIFLTLVALEIILRLAGSIILSIQEHKNRQAIGKKSDYRIMCLGESTTQNQYPKFLEETLNQRSPGIKFSVIDKGMAATDTSLILAQLKTNLSAYNPDMVVVMMGINDASPYIAYKPGSRCIFRGSRVYNLLRFVWLRAMTKVKEAFPRMRPGSAYDKEANFSLDENDLKTATQADSQDSRAQIKSGIYYFSVRKDTARAEEAFKKAIQLDPRSYWAHIELGRLYRWQHHFPKAEEAFKKAIALNPRGDWAYTELGKLYNDQGRISEAEAVMADYALQNDKPCATALLLHGEPDNTGVIKENTVANYRKLKNILDSRGIRLFCVQYPMRSIAPLKEIFKGNPRGIIFVDNEKVFKDAVGSSSYAEYFTDRFGGEFGHCTPKGNQLLAENIADTILKEAF